MLKRTIYIGNPSILKWKNNRLVIEDPVTKEVKGSVPLEDLGFLVLDHYQITLSHLLMVALQQNNVAIISCDETHMPLGLMLPISGHVEHSDRLKDQINCSEPLRKQLWKQTVESKIYQQREVLRYLKREFEPMNEWLTDVKSGDNTNREGVAAQYYWSKLFDNFTRERYGEAPNNLLNFGYMVLRSMVARALVSSGLHPTIGIFHRNKYNAYCLADDIMEPYRPYVDLMVVEWIEQGGETKTLVKEFKAYILQIATRDVTINGLIRPMMTAISITSSSLVKCYSGESRVLHFPVLK